MRCSRETVFLCVCFFLWPPLAVANSVDTQQPITIKADRAVLDEKKQTSTYTGNVILKQGGIEIKANTITVHTKDGQLQSVIAEGDPVKYSQQQANKDDIRGVGYRMEYEVESKSLMLMGGAELWQGGNRFSGETIQYDPDQEKVIATGGSGNAGNKTQRVQITLQPSSEQPQSSESKSLKAKSLEPKSTEATSLQDQNQQQGNP